MVPFVLLSVLLACAQTCVTDAPADSLVETGDPLDSGTSSDSSDTAESASENLPTCGGGHFPCRVAFDYVASDEWFGGFSSSTGIGNCAPAVWPAGQAYVLERVAALVAPMTGPGGTRSLANVDVDWDSKETVVVAIGCAAGKPVGYEVDQVVARTASSIEVQVSASAGEFTDAGEYSAWQVFTFDRLGVVYAFVDVTLH